MTEMIERVAKVIFASTLGWAHNTTWDFGTGPINVSEDVKDHYRKMARAAIEAMKEPTDRMVVGGEAISDFHLPDEMGNTTEDRRKEMKEAYQYMIYLALGGKTDGD